LSGTGSHFGQISEFCQKRNKITKLWLPQRCMSYAGTPKKNGTSEEVPPCSTRPASVPPEGLLQWRD
jgi:hypothetical protein